MVTIVSAVGLDLRTTRILMESKSSGLLSKIRWIRGTMGNAVIRRVLGSWSEVGYEETTCCVFVSINCCTRLYFTYL